VVSACCLLQKAQNICPSVVKKLGSNNSSQRATCASKNGLSARSIFNQLQVAFTGRTQFGGFRRACTWVSSSLRWWRGFAAS
jgi:hypothetical protein